MEVDTIDGLTADQIFDSVSEKVETSTPQAESNQTPQQSTTPDPQTPRSFLTFTHRGKEIQATEDQVRQWASQGYDYAQLVNKYKADSEKLQSEFARIPDFQRLAEIDKFARENPDWKEHLERSWEQRQNLLTSENTQNDPTTRQLGQLMQEVQGIKQFVNETQAEKNARLREQEDAQLESEIKEIRESYPDLDLSAVEAESGKTLEYRILEHGIKNKYPTFKAAFRDFMFDQLQERAKLKAKEELEKSRQNTKAQGIIGKSDKPSSGFQYHGQSYNELQGLALQDPIWDT